MIPPTTLLARPGKADGWGMAMVGIPGGNPKTGGAAASALATVIAASPLAAAAPESVRGPAVFRSGIVDDGWTGKSGAAVGAAVVGGGATAIAVALGAAGTSSFLLHPNDDSKAGSVAEVMTATTSGAVFMRSESIPSPFRSARLSG
jgi:hypothetical protein